MGRGIKRRALSAPRSGAELHKPESAAKGAEASRVDRAPGPVTCPAWEAACAPPKWGSAQERNAEIIALMRLGSIGDR